MMRHAVQIIRQYPTICKVLRNACTCALALALCNACMPPPANVVRIRVWHSEPQREAKDANLVKDFQGPLTTLSVALAGTLTGADVALPLVAAVGGDVLKHFIGRTSDAEFNTTDITVPIAPGQTVTVTGEPGGKTTVTVGEPAPPGEPVP